MNVKEKIAFLQQQLDHTPFSAEKWEDLAELYYKDRQREEALEAIEFSLAIQPEKNPSLRTKAFMLILGKTPQEQQEGYALLEEYCRQCPEDTQVQLLLAFNFMATGRLTEAAQTFDRLYTDDIKSLQELDRLTGRHPEQPGLCLSAIRNYRDLEQYDKASQFALKLLESAPDDPFLHLAYGGIMLRQRRTEEAEEQFAQARRHAEAKGKRTQDAFQFELGREYFEARLYRKAHDTLLMLRTKGLKRHAIPYLACCALELDERESYYDLLEQMRTCPPDEIKHAFRNHIPSNLESHELHGFLAKIYDRCNPPMPFNHPHM